MTRAGFLKRIGLAMAFVVLPDLPKVSFRPVDVEELSLNYILFNSRFTLTKVARWHVTDVDWGRA